MTPETRILQDTVTPALRALSDAVRPERRRPFALVLGRKAEGIYRSWFRFRDRATPNKRGWPRQHFWSRIARRTALIEARTTAASAVVVVADPAIKPHAYGGVIRPKEARALAIPLRAEVYGVRPRAKTIPGIFILKARGKVWLAARRDGALRFFWRLVARVRIPKDPLALPQRHKVGEQLAATGLAFVRRELGRAAR